MLERRAAEQVAPLGAVSVAALDDPPRPSQPAVGPGRLPAKRQVDAEPERAAHGGQWLAGVEVAVVGALQRSQQLVVAADQVRRRGKQLEIVRSDPVRLLGTGQRRKRIGPSPCSEGAAAAVEIARRIPNAARGPAGVSGRPGAPG